MRVLSAITGLVLWAALSSSAVHAETLVEDHTPLAVNFGAESVKLDAVWVKPSGPGPFPIALITNGSPRDAAERPKMSANDLLPQARDFAHRGWLAVGVMRRGFGASEGHFVEGYGDCRAPNYHRAFSVAAEDLRAALRAVSLRPDADASKVLGVGYSAGGASMLTFAALHPPGLVGVINVSGGNGSYAPGKNCSEDLLVLHFTEIGKDVKVPTLWFYAANDQFFGPDLVRRMYVGFRSGGAQADLHQLGPIGSDGHDLWWKWDGRTQWLPILDSFLKAHDFPTWDPASEQALEARLPPRTKHGLADYLHAGSEKAFAVAPSGAYGYWTGARNLEEARRGALTQCDQQHGGPCNIVMEDFDGTSMP